MGERIRLIHLNDNGIKNTLYMLLVNIVRRTDTSQISAPKSVNGQVASDKRHGTEQQYSASRPHPPPSTGQARSPVILELKLRAEAPNSEEKEEEKKFGLEFETLT